MPYENNISFSAEGQPASTVENLNFVNPGSFRLVIDTLKYPNAQFMVQAAAIPTISATGAPYNTPQRNIFASPDKVEYESLTVTFLIDEYLTNYMEIHDWLFGMVSEIDDKATRKTRDLSLLVLDSNNNLVKTIKFVDAFPTSLGSLPFDITITDVEYLSAAVTFEYSYFKIE